MRRFVIAAAVAACAALATRCADAATFQDRVVDGKWFVGSAFNIHAGLIDDCRIQFRGTTAIVRGAGGGQLILDLRDENITDPHEIEADDHRRGLLWTLSLKDLH